MQIQQIKCMIFQDISKVCKCDIMSCDRTSCRLAMEPGHMEPVSGPYPGRGSQFVNSALLGSVLCPITGKASFLLPAACSTAGAHCMPSGAHTPMARQTAMPETAGRLPIISLIQSFSPTIVRLLKPIASSLLTHCSRAFRVVWETSDR